MKPQLSALYDVWAMNRATTSTDNHQISFNDLTNSIVSSGPFSFFIIDFFDMSLSHMSDSLYELHGLINGEFNFTDMLGLIHPEDIGFVARAEDFISKFFYDKIGKDKLTSYKISYNYRAKIKDGSYILFNHQALMLTLDENGGYGKSMASHHT